jgi:phosphoglucose isomerase-like protein
LTRVRGDELVERIWARDATLWTGRDESRWLGWLDEPMRMQERVPALKTFAAEARADGFADTVLLGMGGSSLAPEVLRRLHESESFHVLDTTHPDAVRTLERRLDLARTLFLVASKSGSTLETRCHLDYFWAKSGERPEAFAAVTDPGSELDALATERGFRAVFYGEPTIGGRYSALSPFGMVPGVLIGADVEEILAGAEQMALACRSEESPGVELGLGWGQGWRDGRDKVVINPNPGGFGLWAEQLIAESTGKEGKGLVPAPDESPDGDDRQEAEVKLTAGVGAEFYRFEVATAAVGAVLGVNPYDQPNVQEAKERTAAILAAGGEPSLPRIGSLEELVAAARPGDYFCAQAFVEPTAENEDVLRRLRARVAGETGVVTTAGFGPRYLHSTGQLHKGGPPTGLFLQVVDAAGELEIPGRPFGFGRLIRAQAAGDFDALRERGRRIARVFLDDLQGALT